MKVKCDLDKPTCGRCRKRGADCSWTRKPYSKRRPEKGVDTVFGGVGAGESSLIRPAGSELVSNDVTSDITKRAGTSGQDTLTEESRTAQTMLVGSQNTTENQTQGEYDEAQVGNWESAIEWVEGAADGDPVW